MGSKGPPRELFQVFEASDEAALQFDVVLDRVVLVLDDERCGGMNNGARWGNAAPVLSLAIQDFRLSM